MSKIMNVSVNRTVRACKSEIEKLDDDFRQIIGLDDATPEECLEIDPDTWAEAVQKSLSVSINSPDFKSMLVRWISEYQEDCLPEP
jgi:hypothetical protein